MNNSSLLSKKLSRKELGRCIRNIRHERKYTQADLADLVGTSCSHINKIESGSLDLRLSTLVSICNALNIEVSDVIPKF
ncbi:helix-turn-helix domain-containing protein [Aliivibrio finisterrensis]|uniref:XRE family transcriptional regulator n=1 Tax=Aliivibrio finisterrensis TaxID=511998 RepID=A0A4Q5KWV8_9GAMM|nr:XRE family transcriptional regulator [Aliivibrio finisterrensis]RYU51889.1 XRE family transcriptional regulator [Aliivibrio finisterrensis]RYU56001.1 XRE family transcriptional regulator [Aliivibrio finisterrensis]RYU64714.1 XRE family transcriptional regulator [Aliivibrio finisterrensis]RYU84982.1 XRE family transcriptional regulator [Aliivibrio finisterrensis]